MAHRQNTRAGLDGFSGRPPPTQCLRRNTRRHDTRLNIGDPTAYRGPGDDMHDSLLVRRAFQVSQKFIQSFILFHFPRMRTGMMTVVQGLIINDGSPGK